MMNHKITAYEGNENYIFISYAHKDKDIVFPVMEQLCRRGYRLWYDDGIVPGSEWPEDIARHLNNSAMCIAFVTPNSMASVNCRREINFALSKEKPFLSVVLEPTEMPLGMELQLSAQQSVIRHNYRDEATFLEKIFACPGLACCKAEPEAAAVQVAAKPKAAPAAEESSALKEETAEKAPDEDGLKTQVVQKTKKTLLFWLGGGALVLLAAIVAFVILGMASPDAPAAPAAPPATTAPAPTEAVAQPAEETFQVHAKVPGSWSQVNLWAWSVPDGRKAFDAKPGEKMTLDADGWYTLEVPAWVNRLQLTGNNAAADTSIINVEGKEVWIVINEDLTWQMSYDGPFEGTVTIYARVPEDWDNPHCWAWTSGRDAFDAWPGVPLEKKGNWYAIEVPNWVTGVIINNDDYQTEDIIVDPGWNLWIVERDGWWHTFYESLTEAEVQEFLKGQP